MTIKEQLDADLKTAMLAGKKDLVMTLRGLKGAILNVEVAEGIRDSGLPDDRIIQLFAKEAKKRQESADLFAQGGNREKADAELAEKSVIETYLPAQLSDEELGAIVDDVIDELIAAQGEDSLRGLAMGQVIGAVKQKAGASADGAKIAQVVKERLSH